MLNVGFTILDLQPRSSDEVNLDCKFLNSVPAARHIHSRGCALAKSKDMMSIARFQEYRRYDIFNVGFFLISTFDRRFQPILNLHFGLIFQHIIVLELHGLFLIVRAHFLVDLS